MSNLQYFPSPHQILELYCCSAMPDDSLIILEPAIADNSSAKLVLQKYIKEMDTEGRYACYNINILSIKCLALPIGNETSTAYYQTPAQTSTRI